MRQRLECKAVPCHLILPMSLSDICLHLASIISAQLFHVILHEDFYVSFSVFFFFSAVLSRRCVPDIFAGII